MYQSAITSKTGHLRQQSQVYTATRTNETATDSKPRARSGLGSAIAATAGSRTDPRDRVQVLRKHYLHKKPQVTRSKQISALELYQPNVEMPPYQRGQFAEQLKDPNKFYP